MHFDFLSLCGRFFNFQYSSQRKYSVSSRAQYLTVKKTNNKHNTQI